VLVVCFSLTLNVAAASCGDYLHGMRAEEGFLVPAHETNPTDLTLIHPETTLIHPETTLIHPETTLIHPETTLIHPETTLIHPENRRKPRECFGPACHQAPAIPMDQPQPFSICSPLKDLCLDCQRIAVTEEIWVGVEPRSDLDRKSPDSVRLERPPQWS
jgi:hypothetical protein